MSRRMHRFAAAAVIAAVAFAGLGLLRPEAASAHPLGNFTVSTAARIEPYADAIRIHYAVDMAEIPAFQELSSIDSDGDGAVSEAESEAYLATTAPELVANLDLSNAAGSVPLALLESRLALLPGEGGLETLRIDLVLEAPALAGALRFEDGNYADRLGWREVTLVAGSGVRVAASDVPSESPTGFLTSYPAAGDGPALRTTSAAFEYTPGVGAKAPAVAIETGSGTSPVPTGGFASIIEGRELTFTVVLLMLVVAMGFGAVHALEPGHGKTIVAAYFVGANGRAAHAALLGLIVAVTHSVGVLLIGAVTLYGARYVLPEDLYPWLTLVSGVMVIGLGAGLLASRLSSSHYLRHLATGHLVPHRHHHAGEDSHSHEDGGHHHHHGRPHSHGDGTAPARRWQAPAKYRVAHEHEPAPVARPVSPAGVPWRSLTILGLIDGLIPTPSTLVVLLSAISVGQFALGMALVVAFSVGLAAVLSSISLVTIALKAVAGRFQRRRAGRESRHAAAFARVVTAAPAFAAVALIISGSVVVVRATSGTLL